MHSVPRTPLPKYASFSPISLPLPVLFSWPGLPPPYVPGDLLLSPQGPAQIASIFIVCLPTQQKK